LSRNIGYRLSLSDIDAEALLDDREIALVPAADLECWDQVALV